MQENRAVDDELKAILREIAACLKERNESSSKVRADLAARREEHDKWREQLREDSPTIDLKKANADRETRMAELAVKADQDRQERREFQAALLAELRRLNDNMETFVAQSGSSGVMI